MLCELWESASPCCCIRASLLSRASFLFNSMRCRCSSDRDAGAGVEAKAGAGVEAEAGAGVECMKGSSGNPPSPNESSRTRS